MSTQVGGIRTSLEKLRDSQVFSAPDKNRSCTAHLETSYEEMSQSEHLLKHLTAALFATVLEDIVLGIRLLGDSNISAKIMTIMIDMETLLKKKFGVNLPPADELDTIGDRSLNSYEFKVVKMNKDRMLLIEVLGATYKDLILSGNYNPIIDKNQEIIERKKYYAKLQTDAVKYKSSIKDLRRYLRQLTIQNKSTIYETDAKLDKLEKSIEDTSLIGETRSRYVTNWERARTEQHIKTVSLDEDVFKDNIHYYRNRFEKELIVHTEIESLVNITIKDTLDEIEDWMDKYDKDSEIIDLKIQVKRNEYLDRLNTRIRLEDTISLHNKQMWDWTEFKRKRAEAQKYISDMTRCAIMVQAWWRGILVRKQLGPFKVSKKKKAKKK
ncbi:dynein regulatory complex protein 9-like [Hyposmocoma kahamanoa]|uniref:dynein regulatory complex protein 9-like n=1 Tax=Hyposmocoma kahamanoa TaxID=1477025 RepID=UPI000E6D87BA|nr:dynein regulatory complex protein 9-like [Hyposmocoma kahamanoa]